MVWTFWRREYPDSDPESSSPLPSHYADYTTMAPYVVTYIIINYEKELKVICFNSFWISNVPVITNIRRNFIKYN